jgi:hypothetical protein
MRFVYIKIPYENLPGLRITKGSDDNLATLNEGPVAANAYFTCGDLVLNYNKESGEVLSFDGYLPYFDSLQTTNKLKLPEDSIAARLFVGDICGSPIFNIDKLPLELSDDRSIIHAGTGKYDQILELSADVYVGLTEEHITDIYLHLT